MLETLIFVGFGDFDGDFGDCGVCCAAAVTGRGVTQGFDFGDFGVSFVATVARRYTRWGGPCLSVQGEPVIVLTRGP